MTRLTEEEYQRLQNRFGRKPQDVKTPKPRAKYVHREFQLQVKVANYLNTTDPDVLFESSPANLNLTEQQGKIRKAMQHKTFKPPDMKIYAIAHGFHGLMLELKKETPYKIDGVTLKKNEHVEAQAESIKQLVALGYHVDFYWEYDEILKVIDWYLGETRKL